jgi:hypothetical protein
MNTIKNLLQTNIANSSNIKTTFCRHEINYINFLKNSKIEAMNLYFFMWGRDPTNKKIKMGGGGGKVWYH